MDCPRCMGAGNIEVGLPARYFDLEPRTRYLPCDMQGCHHGALDELGCANCGAIDQDERMHVCLADEDLIYALCPACVGDTEAHSHRCNVKIVCPVCKERGLSPLLPAQAAQRVLARHVRSCTRYPSPLRRIAR